MRNVPSYISERLKKNIQTKANDSAPSARLWISRPSTVLANDEFLERQTVSTAAVTDASIAVCHPRMRRSNTDIYIAYVSNGMARVAMAKSKTNMDHHNWMDTGFAEPATAVSIAFDGTMPKSYGSEIEFITEQTPWVFWVNNGALYARKLGGETVTLAEANCTDVSVVRAAWSESKAFEFGLVAFFIIGGSLYYRQLIGGEWTDGELVSFGPSGVYWSAVSAFRTWDFRVGVQAKSANGDIYELFTQFMGIGTRSAEHFEMKDAKASGTITDIEYHSLKNENEHFEIVDAYDTALYGGCYEIGDIEAIEAWNSDDGSGDWGKYLNVRFTKEINLHQVREQVNCFDVTDSEGTVFYPTTIFADYTGRILTFDFMSFNNAVGDITVSYTPGTVSSMCDNILPAFSFTFTPINLVPVDGLPEVVRLWNSAIDDATIEDGQCVNVQFDQALYGELLDNVSKFTVYTEQRVYSSHPDGTLVPIAVPFVDIRWHPEIANAIQFKFARGNANSLQKCAGRVIVEYKGGNLYGDKGPLLSFIESFTPVGIAYRGDASHGEHLTVVNAKTTSNLMKVYYSSCASPGEHFTMLGASCSGTLTHIDNI